MATDSEHLFVTYPSRAGEVLFAKSVDGGLSWNHGIVVDSGSVARDLYSSLCAVDNQTLLAVYHYFIDDSNIELRFSRSNDGGCSWSTPTVIVSSSAGLRNHSSSIQAIDSNNIAVSYWNDKMSFAKSTDGGSSWGFQRVIDETDGGIYNSLCTSEGSTLFVSYFSSEDRELRFAKSIDGGDNWTFVTVDPTDAFWTSIRAVDHNTIHISYSSQSEGALKVASSVDGGSSWVATVADQLSINPNGTTSLGTHEGNLFVSYFDESGPDLRVARSVDAGRSWVSAVVDDQGNVGQTSSIQVVDGRTIFIAYEDNSNTSLRLAANKMETAVGIAERNPSNILTVKRGSLTDPVADAWTVYSSKRWKKDIETISGALEKIQRLRGVTFEWADSGSSDIGMIAEEVGDVVPEAVAYGPDGIHEISIDYMKLTGLMIQAIKEQSKAIEHQRDLLLAQKEKIAEMSKILESKKR